MEEQIKSTLLMLLTALSLVGFFYHQQEKTKWLCLAIGAITFYKAIKE